MVLVAAKIINQVGVAFSVHYAFVPQSMFDVEKVVGASQNFSSVEVSEGVQMDLKESRVVLCI